MKTPPIYKDEKELLEKLRIFLPEHDTRFMEAAFMYAVFTLACKGAPDHQELENERKAAEIVFQTCYKNLFVGLPDVS